jgi:hypothetical protein
MLGWTILAALPDVNVFSGMIALPSRITAPKLFQVLPGVYLYAQPLECFLKIVIHVYVGNSFCRESIRAIDNNPLTCNSSVTNPNSATNSSRK